MSNQYDNKTILTPELLVQYLKDKLTIKVAVQDVAMYGDPSLHVSVEVHLDGHKITEDSDTFHGLASSSHRHDSGDIYS